MKSIYIHTLFILFIGIVFSSCNKDFLNTQPQSAITSSAIWQDVNLATSYMYDIYYGLENAGFAETMQSSVTDESLFFHNYGQKLNMEAGTSPDDLGWFREGERSGYQWQRMYRNIRSCNDFITNVDKATFEDSKKSQLKGEAYFLRAFYMHRLTRVFGGVPIITKVTQTGESDYTIARNTYTQCVDSILRDIDAASSLLKDNTYSNTQKGRITLAACLALKVRVLTEAASDLHDEATATAKSALLGSYSNKELIFYSKGSRTDRWNAVKTAAKSLIDNSYGHKLAVFSGATVADRTLEFQNFFLSENSETIFARYFINTKDEGGCWIAKFNGPCGYHLWGGNVPIQELVDDYEMADGSKFDWSNPAHKAAIYKNREPRFYTSIMYDGLQYRQRPGDYAVYDAFGQIQTGVYQTNPSQTSEDQYWKGMDSRNGKGETWNGTYTGYYLKKFIDPGIDPQNVKAQVPWVYLRYTEVIFDYIEACIELGGSDLAEAQTWLNLIRTRAMLPVITASDQAGLRIAYRHERRIEMAFEEQRYWDVRRWMIASATPGLIGLHGANVVAKLKPGLPAQSAYKYDETAYDYTYSLLDLSSVESRKWDDQCYFLPILRDELNRNNKLIQNPGYK